MTELSSDLSDTAGWLPLDGLAPGFDANRAECSDSLAGSEVVLQDADQSTRYGFAADRVIVGDGASETTYRYEAYQVADGLSYLQLTGEAGQPSIGSQAISVFLDLTAGRALTVVSEIGEPADRPRVTQRFRSATIAGRTPSGIAPATTRSLIGRRVLWEYSTAHAYEHVYLSEYWYSWQCLAGPERGLADTDACSSYQLRPGIYVFSWREKVIPCAAVTVADHRDARNLRSHGMLFGLDGSAAKPMLFTFGAYGRLLSTTMHPDHLDPAR